MQCPRCHTENPGNPPFCGACGSPLPRELPPDPLIGRVLQGKYKIVKLLGEGGMGAVYVGEQMLGERVRRVAIKTLHAHLSRDPQIRARFNREVGTLAGLEHPNTVQVFDFGQTEDGLLFLVMEFVQGRSIADILEKDGALASSRVEKIVQQIGGSLAEAHAQGIIHRDLKPDNVVLTERAGTKDFVKVLDFGIAKRSGEEDHNEPKLTQQGMVLGTPPYMSPEQFTGQPLDARSDIYSLGVMAYEMLTNTLPFAAETAYEWATLHMTAAPKPIETAPNGAALPESMRAAIMKALSKSPDQRFATVTEFVERFGGHVGPSRAEVAQRAATRGEAAAPGTNAAMPVPSAFAGGVGGVGAAHPTTGQPPKGKTQIGEPLDFGTFSPSPTDGYVANAANGYGGGTQAGMAASPNGMGYGPPPQQGYGPPPQAYVPQAMHAPDREGGSRKGLVIGILAVVGVLSVVALLAGFGVFSSSSPAPVPTLDLGTSNTTAPPQTTAPTSTAGDTPTPTSTPTMTAPTPTLTAPTPSPHPTVKPAPTVKPTATPTTPPTPPPPQPQPTTPPPSPWPTFPPAPPPTPTQPAPTPTPVPTPVPVPPQPPPQPRPSGPEPAACRTLHASPNLPQATRSALEASCRRAGGTP